MGDVEMEEVQGVNVSFVADAREQSDLDLAAPANPSSSIFEATKCTLAELLLDQSDNPSARSEKLKSALGGVAKVITEAPEYEQLKTRQNITTIHGAIHLLNPAQQSCALLVMMAFFPPIREYFLCHAERPVPADRQAAINDILDYYGDQIITLKMDPPILLERVNRTLFSGIPDAEATRFLRGERSAFIIPQCIPLP